MLLQAELVRLEVKVNQNCTKFGVGCHCPEALDSQFFSRYTRTSRSVHTGHSQLGNYGVGLLGSGTQLEARFICARQNPRGPTGAGQRPGFQPTALVGKWDWACLGARRVLFVGELRPDPGGGASACAAVAMADARARR